MAIDVAKLRIDLETLEQWRRRLSVTVPQDEVKKERGEALRSLGKRLKLPGFRKGHVPAGVIQKRFGPSVEREVLDKIIGVAYKQAIESQALHPISEGQIDTVKYEPGEDLSFTISFDVQPQIELARLGGFTAERTLVDVPDERVTEVIDRLRQQQGAWVPVEEGTPSQGHLVNVEIVKLENGTEPTDPQTYEFTLGEGDAIPDVEEAIGTLAIGETGDFDVTFPNDFPNEARRGEVEHLRMTVTGFKALELAEADDAFAKSVGDFESLADLQGRIRADLEKEAADRAEAGVRGQLVDQVVDANAFEAPQSMVDRYIESLIGNPEGVDQERLIQARESLRPEGQRAVKRLLVVERVADLKELRATEDEIDQRIEEMAQRGGTSPAELYARLQKAGRIESLEREITEDKVFAFLKEQSEIIESA